MHYRKGKKTRERALRKLVQQVTKNIEKGIDNKADNGIPDKGETEADTGRQRLKTSLQYHLSNMKS